MTERLLLSGNQAFALAAHRAGVALASGYPGTPSTEILEHLAALGGQASWAPNEKAAVEVAIGAAFAGTRALATMKHVGLNVAADPLFTVAYAGVDGALVLVVADDPGLHSSQDEQDTRRLAIAAGVPVLEPADPQGCYDLLLAAFDLSQRWHLPVIVRPTTRVCHSTGVVRPLRCLAAPPSPRFVRDVPHRVMIPAHARPAHRELRRKLREIQAWNDEGSLIRELPGDAALGVIAAGVCAVHAREAFPTARILDLGLSHPLPLARIRAFAAGVRRCLVIDENDPVIEEQVRAAGITVDGRPAAGHCGELDVGRIRRLFGGEAEPPPPPPGKPPQLCNACPYRIVFGILKELDCLVSGDIGCYTLGALPPVSAMDIQLSMGASIGVGLGLRRTLPVAEARRVVSVIGDSTFWHSGLPGLVEMVYNPPATGHVVVVLDNGTTAMTGRQDHPGTGCTLAGTPARRLVIETAARALGLDEVDVIDLDAAHAPELAALLRRRLAEDRLALIVCRRPCLLAAGDRTRPAARPDLLDIAAPCPPPTGAASVIIAGLGGQGVVTASAILAQAAFRAGHAVTQAEVHGMSQRGGSVLSEVRFGPEARSPMIPPAEADVLLAVADDQIPVHRHRLRPDGLVLGSADLPPAVAAGRSANVGLLALLARRLPISHDHWRAAIRAVLPERLHAANLALFDTLVSEVRP